MNDYAHRTIGFVLGSLILSVLGILFFAGAIKIGVHIYKSITLAKAVYVCAIAASLFALIGGLGDKK